MKHIKKYSVALFIVLLLNLINSCIKNDSNFDSKEYKIYLNETVIVDNSLKRMLTQYICQQKIDRNGVVFQFYLITSNEDETICKLTCVCSLKFLISQIPTGYFFVGDECVLFYSGLGNISKINNKNIPSSFINHKKLIIDIDLPLRKKSNYVSFCDWPRWILVYDHALKKWTRRLEGDSIDNNTSNRKDIKFKTPIVIDNN